MTFFNLAMLGGAAALTIPLVIHLLSRSRFQVVPWGAMHLLESVVRVNRRRMRLEHLLLLLVRCSIPVLLALCMARPLITRWQSLAGNAPTSAVVLLDNSYSMDAGRSGDTALEAARREGASIVSALPKGSDFNVIAMGGRATPLLPHATTDPKEAIGAMHRLQGGYGPARLVDSMELAAAHLARMEKTQRQLIVISDFRQHDWAAVSDAARLQLAQRLKQSGLQPALTFLKLDRPIEENVSVESLGWPPTAVGVGQEIAIQASLRNHGSRSYGALRVTFRVDGVERTVEEQPLGSKQELKLTFRCKFDKPGSHWVEVAVPDDALPADNVYRGAISVLDRIPVLLVDGDPDPRPLATETAFLELALQPFSGAGVKLPDLVETRTVMLKDFHRSLLKDARVVVLANVAKLSPEQLEPLRAFVSAGGGLLVFLGNRVDIPWYNEVFAAPQRGGSLLPMKLQSIVGVAKDSQQYANIVSERFEHPALQLFNEPRQGNLADATIKTWYRLKDEVPASAESARRPVVMARLNSGDPLLVAGEFENGLVMQCATGADLEWSNLPTRGFYLPLVQQLVTFLAARVNPPRNVETGDPLIAFLQRDLAFSKLTLTDPADEKHTVEVAVRDRWAMFEYEATQRPGLYTLTVADGNPLHFAVNAPRSESQLEPLGKPELQRLATTLQAEVVGSADEFLAKDSARRNGQEIWHLLLLLTALAFVAEIYLEQRFARGPR